MDIKAFKSPFGEIIKTSDYSTFVPYKLPPRIEYDEGLAALLSEASLQLGNLSGLGKLIPDPNLLIAPYIRREAVLSSKIEGTQASILDIFNFEAGSDRKENDESKRITEVINYVHSLNDSLNDIKLGKHIDIELIKKAHKILMNKVRGQELNPGELRKAQNWIGVPGTKIQDATYVPPAPEYVYSLLKELEEFINNPPGRIPVLIQCALIHYMFEAIHPFADGNGRIGRLLISLLLAERNILDKPLLYLSAYVERNKTEYYSLLLNISQNSNWIDWIKFFLNGVILQANESIDSIQRLLLLKNQYETKLNMKKASRSTSMAVDLLFSNPVITIPGLAKYLHITYTGSKKIINGLETMDILHEQKTDGNIKTFMAFEIASIFT
jgi:Fic family protein